MFALPSKYLVPTKFFRKIVHICYSTYLIYGEESGPCKSGPDCHPLTAKRKTHFFV
jgi:hypothetical protein